MTFHESIAQTLKLEVHEHAHNGERSNELYKSKLQIGTCFTYSRVRIQPRWLGDSWCILGFRTATYFVRPLHLQKPSCTLASWTYKGHRGTISETAKQEPLQLVVTTHLSPLPDCNLVTPECSKHEIATRRTARGQNRINPLCLNVRPLELIH